MNSIERAVFDDEPAAQALAVCCVTLAACRDFDFVLAAEFDHLLYVRHRAGAEYGARQAVHDVAVIGLVDVTRCGVRVERSVEPWWARKRLAWAAFGGFHLPNPEACNGVKACD